MTDLHQIVAEAHRQASLEPLIEAIPYAQLLGIRARVEGAGVCFHLPPRDSNIGNPTLPAIHGGALGGFMELSAALHLIYHLDTPQVPKVVDFSIDYVRAGLLVDTYARCTVVRQGRKVVNVAVSCWQQAEENPIATARSHFLLP